MANDGIESLGCNKKSDIVLILHGVDLEFVSKCAKKPIQYFQRRFKIFSSEIGVQQIAKTAVEALPKKVLLVMRHCKPPCELVICPGLGELFIGKTGLIPSKEDEAPYIEFMDFSGRRIDHKTARSAMGVMTNEVLDGDVSFSAMPFYFKTYVRYAHLVHRNVKLCDRAEVKRGCYINVGTNESPYVITPFFTCDAFTGGIIEDRTTPFIDECLEIARGSWRGRWKKLSINEDGTSFSVLGE